MQSISRSLVGPSCAIPFDSGEWVENGDTFFSVPLTTNETTQSPERDPHVARRERISALAVDPRARPLPCCNARFVWRSHNSTLNRCAEHSKPPSLAMVEKVMSLVEVVGGFAWCDDTEILMPIWRRAVDAKRKADDERRRVKLAAKKVSDNF